VDKPLTLFSRLVLIGAGGLAILAGPVLYFFPYNTETYFAWTIAHPLTPVYMGASYFAGIGNLIAIKENRWSLARVQMPAILTFATTMLIATLLHIPIFNWSHPIAWAWLAVYVLSPIGATIVMIQQERGFTVPEFDSQKLPASFSTVMRVLAILNLVIGFGLFFLPSIFSAYWAWSLTLLTSRVIGGWYLSSVALQWFLSQQRTLHTARVGLIANVLVTSLLVLGAFLHFDNLDGPSISVWGYLTLNAILGGFSLYSLLKSK